MGIGKTFPDFKPLLIFFAGTLSVILVVITVNKVNNCGSSSYFFPNYSYLLSTGADEKGDISSKGETSPTLPAKTAPTPSESASRAIDKISHYAIKVYYIFNNFEMPNNINYYFIQEKLPISRLFIGPALLIPLALTGLILMIYYGGLHKKESILFFYIAAFAIPICLFLPLGRYKLVLAPIFCIGAAYTMIYLNQIITRKGSKLHNILTPSLLAILLFLTISTRSYPTRSSDIKAYGLAAVYVPDKLMKKGNFKDASLILSQYYRENQTNVTISIYYASSLLGSNRPKDAEFVLSRLGVPEDIDSRSHYYFELGECYRLLNRREDAIRCYNQVPEFPCSDKLKETAKFQLKKLM